MSGALQRSLEECLKLITLSVIGNRFAVVAVEIRPPPARTKIGPLACYASKKSRKKNGAGSGFRRKIERDGGIQKKKRRESGI